METTAEVESFIQEEFEEIAGIQSGSFERFWGSIRYTFKDRPYQWRKELCLHMIERMLREDRCRLFPHSDDLGWLKPATKHYWLAPIDQIMQTLREHWARYEGKPVGIHTPDGFDTGYFVMVIPTLQWPPYITDDA